MFTRRRNQSAVLASLGRRVACLAAVATLFIFATAVSADTPPTGTITSGTVTYPAYTYPYYATYPYAVGYIAPAYVPPGVYGGISCGGVYGCPLNVPTFGYGTYVRGNLYCGLYDCGIAQPIQR